jgi:hypothetical protein
VVHFLAGIAARLVYPAGSLLAYGIVALVYLYAISMRKLLPLRRTMEFVRRNTDYLVQNPSQEAAMRPSLRVLSASLLSATMGRVSLADRTKPSPLARRPTNEEY